MLFLLRSFSRVSLRILSKFLFKWNQNSGDFTSIFMRIQVNSKSSVSVMFEHFYKYVYATFTQNSSEPLFAPANPFTACNMSDFPKSCNLKRNIFARVSHNWSVPASNFPNEYAIRTREFVEIKWVSSKIRSESVSN